MHSFRRRPVSAYWSDHLSPRMTPCLPGISSSLEHSSMIMARGEWRSNPYEFHSDRGTMPKPSQMISDRTEAQELFHRELLGARRNQSARKFNSSTRIVHTNIELRSFRNRRIIDREYIWKFVIRFYYYRHLIRSRNNPQLNLLNYEWNLGYARRGCSANSWILETTENARWDRAPLIIPLVVVVTYRQRIPWNLPVTREYGIHLEPIINI